LEKLSFSQNAWRWLWISVIIVVIDQLTKFAAVVTLTLNQPVKILPFLNITLMRNTGAAFSFLATHDWSSWLFGIFAVVISVCILVWLKRLPKNRIWLAVALTLILGGAIGNLIDRIHLGFVIDFIQLHYQNRFYWPAFNIADSAITVGAVMVALEVLFSKHH